MDNKDVVNKFLRGRRPTPTVCYPAEIENDYVGDLYGYYQNESNYYNVISKTQADSTQSDIQYRLGEFLGKVDDVPNVQQFQQDRIIGFILNGETFFITVNGEKCETEKYQQKMDIFSRNTGILESDVMLKKGVVIIGCGSVGSLVALELARAGVGRFFLVDMDVLKYHNICRHQCGVQDVGKYKTTAVKERILQINPSAQVKTSHRKVQDIALSEFEEFCNPDTIVVGCADNRQGDLYADSMLCKPFGMPFVSIGCWERAFAGEIFYCLPTGMPSYKDFMASVGVASERKEANTHLYMGEVGSFEPGISVDINFVTTIGIKIILDLLNRDNPHFTQRLVPHLTQYTLVCNTNDPHIGGVMAEIFSYPLQVTRSIVVEYANNQTV